MKYKRRQATFAKASQQFLLSTIFNERGMVNYPTKLPFSWRFNSNSESNFLIKELSFLDCGYYFPQNCFIKF